MKISLLFIYFLSLTRLFAFGQNKTKPFPTQKSVTAAMNKAMTKNDLPAVVVIAINNKNQEVTYCYGKAVWNGSSNVTDQNIFRIASMTKLITAIAAMQLVEKGLIGLDDSLSLLLPEMAKIPILNEGRLVKANKPITLRHLLTHTSGFGYSLTDKELANFDNSKLKFSDLPRRFESGTKFLYGTSTYWVGKLVEKISGIDLELYFRNNITGPLKMNRTFFNLPDSIKEFVVSRGARGADGQHPLTELPDRIPTNVVTDFRGDGGLFSTPSDYTILLKCMLNYGTLNNIVILKKQTVLQMLTNQIGDISMKGAGSYFDPSLCCNFKGIISPSSKFSFAGLIDNENKPYGPRAGTISWGGAFNTYFYIDYKSGIAASIYTQHIPFDHPETITLFHKFSELIYGVKSSN